MDELRPLVLARARYHCERCYAWRDLEAHHRLMRSQGGPDTMENLVALCLLCHRWVHHHPTDAYEVGLLIESADGPPGRPWTEPLPAIDPWS